MAETSLDTGIRTALLLVVLVSGLVASTRADDKSTTVTATSPITRNVTFPLPSNCPTSCGNITFEFPFGVGHGCFVPGFDLICNTTTNTIKLFLGNTSSVDVVEVVDQIDILSYLHVRAPVAKMDVHKFSSSRRWASLVNTPFFYQGGTNYFWVEGCSAVGSLVDLNSNETLATCNTTCPDKASCYVVVERDVRSFGILLSRTNNHGPSDNVSVVKASVGSGDRVLLSWGINVQPSCKEAQKDKTTYACISPSSVCFDNLDDSSSNISYGYWCACQNNSLGNPYMPHGCGGVSSSFSGDINVHPSSNCEKQCGNVSIPFPFGLQQGCYRDESFVLTCNDTFDPPVLFLTMSDSYNAQVNNIMLEQGEMDISSIERDSQASSPAWDKPFMLLQDRVIMKWAMEYGPCAAAMHNSSNFACLSSNSICVDTNITRGLLIQRNTTNNTRGLIDNYFTGYICKCPDGFRGNPYLPDGCQDINECETPEKYGCHGHCFNTVGSYTCTSGVLLGVIIGVSTGVSTLLLTIASFFAIRKWKKISQKRIRKRHFKENHGLLLQQFIASNEDASEKIKIFSLKELEKATNNFDVTRILGQGGHGTVYKGILSDQRVVAIKRSKIKKKSEIDEFLNEVTILSQINHRNIVKLFGCCLETEVPLLVYEFISNGTLFRHLHNLNHKSTLSWLDRLRIAAEAAGALEYLHSSASISIFHRDVKSSNILLDDYYTVKISDFGASRLIPLDQSHIFTAIQGTYGYLDPEYHRTGQLSEKSDVYSFGVILLELVTGEKPISVGQNGEKRNLVMQFLQALRENRQLELMEERVKEEGTREELDKVSELAEMCLKLKGSERPTMREVEVELRKLQKANIKGRERRIAQQDEEIAPLVRDFSSSPGQSTRNYSQELEFISSLRNPR